MTMRTKRAVVEIREDELSDEDAYESNEEQEEESDNEAGSIEEDESSDNEEESLANTGWADSIAKILKTSKPKGKKTVVLSKAKKITDVKKVKENGFEVDTKDGEMKREHEESDDEKDVTNKLLRKRKKDLPILRVKPDILNKDRERLLSKIATRGVVQLFNAVKQQQKDIDSKLKDAGSLEVKRDKVLKSIDKKEFLNVLMGRKILGRNDVKSESKPVLKNESNDNGPTWKVLRDDFMMSAKMKDWDKELEDDVDMKDENDDST